MNAELDEALSAWLDGEVPPHDVLRRALARPDAIATLLGLLDVRAAVQTEAMPRQAAVEATGVAMTQAAKTQAWVRARRWGAGATLVLVLGVGVGVGVAATSHHRTEPDGPPAADLIARVPFQPPIQETSEKAEVMP